MSKLQKRIASTIGAGAMLINLALPAMAGSTTLTISGNGAETDNDVNVQQQSQTVVVQSNTANISNDVNAEADTGDNDANMNTGGDVMIDTGNASTGVGISNEANSNVADVEGCCAVDAEVEISGNGYESDNDADLRLKTDTQVFQDNYAKIKNDVEAESETGENDANMNTGGDVMISTGKADTTVLISNSANSNSATIGDGSGSGWVSLKIKDNGAYTTNDINLAMQRSLLLDQSNLADIRNKVDAEAETGENDANMNTGGDVMIDTGKASTAVGIDNMANFNFADLDCGCLLDISAKIAGNGYESDNVINARLLDSKAAFQDNEYVCGHHGYQVGEDSLLSRLYGKKHACNDVEAEAETGENDGNSNTGDGSYEDPVAIGTGNAESVVSVENTANANVLTEGGLDYPDFPEFDFDFDLGFNWALLWAWFAGSN
jgi:hypothetical protein